MFFFTFTLRQAWFLSSIYLKNFYLSQRKVMVFSDIGFIETFDKDPRDSTLE